MSYGGDPEGTNYSALAEVNRSNVDDLRIAWTWSADEALFEVARGWGHSEAGREIRPGFFEATPIMVRDTLFLSTPLNRAVALDARTGREIWSYDPGAYRRGWLHWRSFVHRGVAQWSDGETRRIFLNTRARLIALDAATGRPIPSFGSAGEVGLTPGLRWETDEAQIVSTSPPVVFDSLVIVGFSVDDTLVFDKDPPGAVQAFHARTGERAWVFHTIPQSGEFGAETWESGAEGRTGHANVWAPMTLDPERGLLYVPVSAASNDFYGGRRPGDNLFAESLVCLDARTGRRLWHYQIVHHGLWDYDLAAPPALVAIEVDGRPIDAVTVSSKTGFLYVFDRVSGEPVWPIAERPVPASDVPGEKSAPTQPFPTKPPPFARQGFTEEDLIDFTPEIRRAALDQIEGYRLGPLFTPPSERGTVVLPGWIGGAAWGGTAFDPESSTLYVKASNRASVIRLVKGEGQLESAGFVGDWPLLLGNLEGVRWGDGPGSEAKLPLNKPPYGTVTAIDLDRGEIRWQVTVGDQPGLREHPALKDLDLPPLGVAGPPGAIVTAGGLVFVSGGGPRLYALDADTGATLWEGDLPGRGNANPMTYRTRAGRQYIVIATGGVSADVELVAFTLR